MGEPIGWPKRLFYGPNSRRDSMRHYSVEEREAALTKAINEINKRTEDCLNYTRGVNDCAALLVEYDKALRGDKSKAELSFAWNNPVEFISNLRKSGYTAVQYFERCNYEIVKNKRPLVGDVSFAGGALIAGPEGWVTTTETNKGVKVAKQLMFFEPKMSVIARPIKD
jgi:hypothetical protein